MDLVRHLLFKLEAFEGPMSTYCIPYADPSIAIDGYGPDQLLGHLEMLIDSGLIVARLGGSGDLIFQRLSWEGHEFAASVRDAEVWEQTKAAAKKGGVETLTFLWEIAKGIGKQQLKARTGLEF